MSMYRGTKRFDKAQLEFIVEVMIASCIDTIESYLPQTPDEIKDWAERVKHFGYMYHTALDQLGWNLSILYAQVDTTDGMGVADALSIVKLEAPLQKWIKTRTDKNWKGYVVGQKICPIDVKPLARRFVKKCFNERPDDYLKFAAPFADPKPKPLRKDGLKEYVQTIKKLAGKSKRQH